MSNTRPSTRPPAHRPRTVPPPPKKGGTLPLEGPDSKKPDSGPVSQEIPPSMPAHTMPLPSNAPEWMQRARVMSATIEAAIARGEPTPQVKAAIQRAWQTWSLGGYRPKQIAAVARIVDRAYQVLRQPTRQDASALDRDCAALLLTSLPPDRRSALRTDEALAIVAMLRDARDGERARIEATAQLLGWTEGSRKWMRDAIAAALREVAG